MPQSLDPISVFVELFDRLSAQGQRRGLAWWADTGSAAISAPVFDRVRTTLARSGEVPATLLGRAKSARERLAIALAIDRVIGEVLRLPETDVPMRLRYIRRQYIQSGRLGVGKALVLPRREGYHGTRNEEGIYSVVENVIRVSRRCSSTINFVNALSATNRVRAYSTGVGRVGVSVGCVPFLDHPADMRFERISRGRHQYYCIEPRAELRERIPRALARLDQSGAVVGIVPEMALSPELLDSWRRAVVRGKPKSSRLRWILVGTGRPSVDNLRSAPPNTAVLLDRESGLEVAQQRKRNPFNLQADDVRRYGLERYLGSGPLREYVEPGRELTVVETDFGRLGVCVCEDLDRMEVNMTQARELGITHIFVPVFSKALRDNASGRWSWEVIDATKYSDALGICVAVATSLVIHRSMTLSEAAASIDPPVTTSASVAPGGPRDLEPVFGTNQGDPLEVAIHPLKFRPAIS